MKVTFAEVKRNVSEIANRDSYDQDVLFELMAAYGRSASSITKLRSGVINQVEDKENTVLQRGVVYLKHTPGAESLPAEVEKLEQDPLTSRYNPRFLIATDYVNFAAKDTKKGNTLEIAWKDIDRNVDFFYGWTGDEVTDEKTEAAADRRAADKMKDLYEEIEKVNSKQIQEQGQNYKHDLNVFFTRLLFCFFAEDTKVFSDTENNMFTDAIKDFTATDGSDLDGFLRTLFESLDVKDKSEYTSPFSKFPYVNGNLFDNTQDHKMPKFNAQARKHLLDCGNVNWAEITPDIFGSMFQSIARRDDTQHFTSVPNILKTIEPLFLDELREELDKNFDNLRKLEKLLDRISNIKVFDPACGSGNFLVVAYRELRKLEHGIIERLYQDDFKRAALKGKLQSKISLDNFYGIEIGDFECEIATLSMLIAKHQMNIEFEKQFGKEIKLIPLKDKANIVHGNAARIDWQTVCPNESTTATTRRQTQEQLIADEHEQSQLIDDEEKQWEEIYLISNPPYLGSRNQNKYHKEDMKVVLSGKIQKYKILDYISIWFYKGAEYINDTSAKLAFVTTNSITQGDQVSTLWPNILDELEIGFAYTSFKWENNAKNSAGVTVLVIGIQNPQKSPKVFFDNGVAHQVENINAYIAPSHDVYVSRSSKPLNGLPRMTYGNYTGGCNSLILSTKEKNKLVQETPSASKIIRKFVGSAEFLNDKDRYCLWIDDEDVQLANSIPEVKSRIDEVYKTRLDSKDPSLNKLAQRPHQFRDFKTASNHTLIVPIVFSERRRYIVAGILDADIIVPNSAQAVYDAPIYVLSLLSSKMHMAWVRAVAGRLKTDYRYSSAIVYNTFPVKPLNDKQKEELEKAAREILFARENHSEKTLAEMYDPDKMPEDLKDAHEHNDLVVDRLYRLKPYQNDEERLAGLFELYEKMTADEEK